MHRIVIVGGGAAGLELATRLGNRLGKSGRAHVILVDRSPTHVWKPLLHEVAVGSLDVNANQIAYAAHAHWNHFTFVQGELTALDRGARQAIVGPLFETEAGGGDEVLPRRSLEYDTLILALGSRTHFFGVPGAEEYAIALDTLEQAERVRKRLLQVCVKKTAQGSEGETGPVRVTIIGAGATGVELAAELRRMEHTWEQFGVVSRNPKTRMRINLIEAGSRVLPALPQMVSDSAQVVLERMGITVLASKSVTRVRPHEVELADGRAIPTDITIWAAGIRAPGILASLDGIAVNRINQVRVSRSLQSETDENIFALGDCASCIWTGEVMVPPRAQAAHQQAMFLFKALCARIDGRPLGMFEYRDHGSLISLGSSTAVGSLAGVTRSGKIFVHGLIAEFMYASLYRKHMVAVSGLRRALLATIANGIGRILSPRVKLH
ncbi:NAD(P)/FAD-dependent oxidoreductase [Paraburkholderia sp. UYCP14C]|uniref:NAD(P)/FAD-dependent oxidoreductase n=1 Tax=Paraburkholderia sp. UYCP14C TaxID=2511130 RepID=UPI00101FCD9B|nr:NAD(P)/FAD-dependent oxidoreductase [Paraburkholderia sp. UYCP14C]RZF25716.1 NAD(P)/FAD-dependent oxidoreductase [Paraburkholderia sp. UYCP14C]